LSIDNNSLQRTKRRKNAPATRSNETDEDDNMRETTDGMVEEMVAGLMPGEPSVELEQATQHWVDKALLAEATDETTADEPEVESTSEEPSENLEASLHNRAANAAPESAIEILQPNAPPTQSKKQRKLYKSFKQTMTSCWWKMMFQIF
jgi:hypothetical protein